MARAAVAAQVDPREATRAKLDAARHALMEAEQRYGRASHVVQWGSSDPREEAVARRDIYTWRADAIEARAAAEEAEREYVRASAGNAEARAPHHRSAQQRRTQEMHALLTRVVQLGEAIEAAHADAQAECCVSGQWFGSASDRSIAEIAAMVRGVLPAWTQRMGRAGWLTSQD